MSMTTSVLYAVIMVTCSAVTSAKGLSILTVSTHPFEKCLRVTGLARCVLELILTSQKQEE